MCEFCTEHGEGKKWYLQMKNYSDVLLHEQLSSPEKEMAGATTRLEWIQRYYEEFIIPAGIGAHPPEASQAGPSPGHEPAVQPSEEEVLARRKAEEFGQVLPIEDVEQVIQIVDSVTRMPCGCRFVTTGKADKRYCFGFGVDKLGILGKFPDAASCLEVLEKQEAMRILHDFDEEGLVHTIWTAITPYSFIICNCDRDCMSYKGYIEMRGSPRFFRAEYVCQTDWDLCTGCKSCMSQCQFGAVFYSSALSKVHIDPTRCFGCGVCRAVCPNDAITLVPRQDHPEAAGIWLRDPAG